MTADSEHLDNRGSLVDDFFWAPHSSPQSVWGLVAVYPVLILAVYRRNWRLVALILLSVVANIRLAAPPATDEAWATRVVLGERVWIERGLRTERWTLGLVLIGAVVNVATLRAAVSHKRNNTAIGTISSMGIMFLFFDRMARLYEQYGEHHFAEERLGE